MATSKNDLAYAEALQALQVGRPTHAESILQRVLDSSPAAAQSLYLLGVSLVVQERYEEARLVLDRAYAHKPWLRDVDPGVLDIRDAVLAAVEHVPTWDWPRYEIERLAFFSVGLRLQHVVARHLAMESVRFIEVGANDGVGSDPIHEHVEMYGWSGVCVEPVPEAFDQLVATYADNPRIRCERAAVTDRDGTVTMHVSRNTKLASILPERNAMSRVGSTRTVEVPTTTFATLMSRHDMTTVDVLQIDTEGFDYQVLHTFDLTGLRPTVVNMEFYCLPISERIATFSLLRSCGYAYRFDGMDLIAIDLRVASPAFLISDRTSGRYLPDPPEA